MSVQAAWQMRAVNCIDLTTLSGDDTPTNVNRLCYKATYPIQDDLLKAMDMESAGTRQNFHNNEENALYMSQ